MNKLKIAPICFIILFSFIPNLLVNKITNNHCTIKKNFDKKYQILDNGYWFIADCEFLIADLDNTADCGFLIAVIGFEIRNHNSEIRNDPNGKLAIHLISNELSP